MVINGGSASSAASQRRKKKRRKEEAWLNLKIIRSIRKMKLAGLRQALKPGLLWIERLFWVGVFVLCVGYTIYLTVSTVNEYSENPILNSFNDDKPITVVPFPATTITGTMILKNNATDDVYDLYDGVGKSDNGQFKYEGLTWTFRVLDVLLFTMDHLCELVNSFASRSGILDTDKVKALELKNFGPVVDFMNVTLYDNKDAEEFRKTVVPYLKTKTIDCNKILAACFWEGNETNCKDVFVPIQTDVGTGCSFNRIPDKILRKREGLISLFHNHTYDEKELSSWAKFKSDSTVSLDGIRDFYEMSYPKVQHHAGKQTGLSFMLIFDESDEGTSCPIVDSYGYLIGIHSPFEEPRIMQTGISVPPNKEVFIKVKAELTIADPHIRALSIERRKCYFQVENPLKKFNVYTVSNCHQECLGQKIKEDCNCTLLTLSEGLNEILCGPSKVTCVKEATAQLETNGYDKLCRNPVCYSPCTEVKYDADVSYLPYHQRGIFKFSSRNLKEGAVTSIVHVAHGSNSVSTRERKLQFGFSILVGVIGGTWGMTLEFSLYTLFNIIAGLAVLLTPECAETDTEETEGDIPNPDETINPDLPRIQIQPRDVENPDDDPAVTEDSANEDSTVVSDGSSESSSPESNSHDIPDSVEDDEPTVSQGNIDTSNTEDEESTLPPETSKSAELHGDQPEAPDASLLNEDPLDWDKILEELLELTEPIQ